MSGFRIAKCERATYVLNIGLHATFRHRQRKDGNQQEVSETLQLEADDARA